MSSRLLSLLLSALVPGQALAAAVQPVRIETPPLSGAGLPGVNLVSPAPAAAPSVSVAPALVGTLPSAQTLTPAQVAPALSATLEPVRALALPAAQIEQAEQRKPEPAEDGGNSPEQAFSQGRALFDGAGSVRLNGIDLPGQAFADQDQLSSHIIRAVDAARESVEVALHGIALEPLADALIRAHERGVRVRVIMNRSHVYPEKRGQRRTPEVQKLMDSGVNLRVLRGTREHGIMHNKFALIDGKMLESGSYNWTQAADDYNHEDIFFTGDSHRVEGYREYWKWMWGLSKPLGDRAPPASDQDQGLDAAPPIDTLNPVRFNGEDLPAYSFAPNGGTEGLLVKVIDAARRTIDLAMFSLTLSTVQEALLRARERGVRVRIVFDRAQYGRLEAMRWFVEQGFDVLVMGGRRAGKGALHYKFAVFDGLLAESGSFNYTFNAEKNNFENANFFDDAGAVSAYSAAFERLLRKAISPSQDLELMEFVRLLSQRMTEAAARGAEGSGRGLKRAQALEADEDVVQYGLDAAHGL